MSKLLETLVTIDFETEAINGALPPKPVGVAVKLPGRKSCYFSWGHLGENNYTWDAAKNLLTDIFKNHPILCHNAAFDLNVAKYWFGINYPKEIHDTLFLLFIMDPHAKTLSLKPSAEAILNIPPEERDFLYEWILTNVPKATKKNAGAFVSLAPVDLVAPYACMDTDMTYNLFVKLYPLYKGEAYTRECQLLPILNQNTLDGIQLNTLNLYKDFVTYSKTRKEVEARIFKYLGTTFNLDSCEELAAAITKANIQAEWVYTKTGKASTSKGNLITAIEDTYLLDLLNYRATLSTYLDTFFISWIDKEINGKLHFIWNQVRNQETGGFMGTRTGRVSTQPSMLNVPGKAKLVPEYLDLLPLPVMKSYLLPDDGDIWTEQDYRSQELKVLAHYEDGAMMQAYIDNPKLDLHQMMAEICTEAIHKPVSRRAAKTVAFSILYGSGLTKLAEGLNCSYAEAQVLKAAYLKSLPGIKAVQNSIKQSWDNGDPIKTWGGRYYSKEPSKEIQDKVTKELRMADFTYKGLNYLIQGSSADITKQAIINYNSIKKDGRFLLSVHDSINISAPLSEVKLLTEAMCDIKLDVPLITDIKIGPNYGELNEYP